MHIEGNLPVPASVSLLFLGQAMFLLPLKLHETESFFFIFQYRQLFADVPAAILLILLFSIVLNVFLTLLFFINSYSTKSCTSLSSS